MCSLKLMMKMNIYIFTAIFFICGVTILAVGIWVSTDGDKIMKVIAKVDELINGGHSFIQYIPYILMGIGGLVIVIGIFGCYGAYRNIFWLLRLYAGFVGFSLIPQVMGVIRAALIKKEIDSKLDLGFIKILPNISFYVSVIIAVVGVIVGVQVIGVISTFCFVRRTCK